MKNILPLLIFVFCSTLLCEAQTRQSYDEERYYSSEDHGDYYDSGSNPITVLIGFIIFGYGLYRLIKWFASENKNEKDAEEKKGAAAVIGKLVLFFIGCAILMKLKDAGVDGKVCGVLCLAMGYWFFKSLKDS
jgi:L-asparagine transporter-like permease